MRVWIAESLSCFFAERLTQKPFEPAAVAVVAAEAAGAAVATAELAAGPVEPAGFAA